MNTKNEIRKMVINTRNSMTKNQVLEKSSIIVKKLTASEEYIKSQTVFIYMDFKNEVMTSSLIKKMLDEGKRVVIPYTDTLNTVIIPVELHNIEEDLKVCSFGYLEPKKEKIVPVELKELDLIIVPGVAFDKNLNRIGFGKGYYDRILTTKRHDAKAVAIAYELQVLEEIPYEEHDVKMDIIITEENIYN